MGTHSKPLVYPETLRNDEPCVYRDDTEPVIKMCHVNQQEEGSNKNKINNYNHILQ